MSTSNREVRLALLARARSEKETIFFPVLLTIVEDESALFNASIVGMEDRIIAMGVSEDDATDSAIELFKDTVDTALDKNLPLGAVLGTSPFKVSTIPLAQASQMLHKFQELLQSALDEEDGWTRLDPGFTSWAMSSQTETHA